MNTPTHVREPPIAARQHFRRRKKVSPLVPGIEAMAECHEVKTKKVKLATASAVCCCCCEKKGEFIGLWENRGGGGGGKTLKLLKVMAVLCIEGSMYVNTLK